MNAVHALPWVLLVALFAGLIGPLVDPSLAPIGASVVPLALAGLLILYVVAAGRQWAAGRRLAGVLMLALPAVAYAFAAGPVADLGETGVGLAVAFGIGAVVAAAACAAMTLVLGRGSRRRAPGLAVSLAALVVVSALATSWASPSYLGPNVARVMKELLPDIPDATPSWTPATTGTTPAAGSTTYGIAATTRAVETQPTAMPWETDDWDFEITVLSTPRPTAAVPPNGGGGHSFPYTLRGARRSVAVPLDGNIAAALAVKRPPFDGDYGPYYRGYVDEASQRPAIAALAGSVRQAAASPDDQARVAVALVQAIPYDWAAFLAGTDRTRYPYEVLCGNTGVCGEKSLLLAALLRELGFGVALLEFGPENHMAVGIAAPAQFCYGGTGYAFVETTQPTIITDAEETYVGAGRLTSDPEVYPIAGGRALGSLAEETADLAEFRSIQAMGRVLDAYHYDRWRALVEKYGLIVGS